MAAASALQLHRPILIGGAPSSGSTLLSMMLDAHPEVHCGPETGILAHAALFGEDFPAAARALMPRLERPEWEVNDAVANFTAGFCPYALVDSTNLAAYQLDLNAIKTALQGCVSIEAFIARLFGATLQSLAKKIFAEKTPSNLYAFEAFLNHFPEGRVLYLVRDPRAVVASLLRRGFALHRAIAIWLIETAICERLRGHPRALQVKYEHLVRQPDYTLLEITKFLKVQPAVDKMSRYWTESLRAERDPSLRSLASWLADPSKPISLKPIDAWRCELDPVVLAIMERAMVARAPRGLEAIIGVGCVQLAERLLYHWEPAPADPAAVLERLIAEGLVDNGNKAYDRHIFHERYADSAPPDLTTVEEKLWSMFERGIAPARMRQAAALDKLIRLREQCSQLYQRSVDAVRLANQLSAEHDQRAVTSGHAVATKSNGPRRLLGLGLDNRRLPGPSRDKKLITIMRVVGARPQFMQEVVFRQAVDARGHHEILVHTGQHYDERMSKIFFEELGIPCPDINLGIGSGKHGYQTGHMLEALDEVIEAHRPDALVVDGDTNSTLAGALSAAKWHVPLIHVEAGLRSFDRRMPEEVNRIVADHLAELLCAPTAAAVANLADEGLASRAVLTGDLMYDCFVRFSKAADAGALTACQVAPSQYLLATVHRAENADNPVRFTEIVTGLCALPLPVVMPAHPRIHAQLLSLLPSLPMRQNLRVVEPVGYLAMLALELHAACVLTDSGGVQREAYFAGRPSVILRDTTEWREQVDSGWSKLAGADAAAISACCEALMSVQGLVRPPIYGDGSAATKVIAAIDEMLG